MSETQSAPTGSPHSAVTTPPSYCQYADGPCDQSFESVSAKKGIFLYPSDPENLAATIEAACERLNSTDQGSNWATWKDFHTTGQIIFCSICKSMRFCQYVIADVTTLNFNLLFEIGFALGLGKPVIPIRDRTYMRDRQEFVDLGLLDTIGYTDFQNSEQLSTKILEQLPVHPLPVPGVQLNLETPLYVVKGPIDTEGGVRLLTFLKRSAVRFRTYDVIETPRISLHEARRQVASSLGVITHLLSPERQGAAVHNARCALVAGIAMASGKATLLLQEEDVPQPLDYREVVKSYQNPVDVPQRTEGTILRVIQNLQTTRLRIVPRPEGLLQKLDIGDVAAENEIHPLASYFVETGQFNEAKRGHARLVVGRKGSGKTAIFYALQQVFGASGWRTVIDLKPEGHQFTKLREAVLSKMTPGVQEHTLVAFWTYLLLVELAESVHRHERSWAVRDSQRLKRFQAVEGAYAKSAPSEESDFSERLLSLVNRLSERFQNDLGPIIKPEITEVLFAGDIRALEEALTAYWPKRKRCGSSSIILTRDGRHNERPQKTF